jgi:hypothetical protein
MILRKYHRSILVLLIAILFVMTSVAFQKVFIHPTVSDVVPGLVIYDLRLTSGKKNTFYYPNQIAWISDNLKYLPAILGFKKGVIHSPSDFNMGVETNVLWLAFAGGPEWTRFQSIYTNDQGVRVVSRFESPHSVISGKSGLGDIHLYPVPIPRPGKIVKGRVFFGDATTGDTLFKVKF